MCSVGVLPQMVGEERTVSCCCWVFCLLFIVFFKFWNNKEKSEIEKRMLLRLELIQKATVVLKMSLNVCSIFLRGRKAPGESMLCY